MVTPFIRFIFNVPNFFCTDRVQMPYRLPRRLRLRRKPAYGRRRRPAYRRKWQQRRQIRHGYIYISRKLSNITVQSGAGGVAGAPFLNDPTGTCLTLGTPVGTTMANVYDVPFSMGFQLNQLMNSNELTAIADKYRILSASVKVHYNNTAGANGVGGTGTSGSIPWIEYIQDKDDALPPSIAGMREKMGCRNKYFSSSKPAVTMAVRPVPAPFLLGSGYAVPSRSPYINTSNAAVPHYGLKGVFHSLWLPTTVVGLMEFDVTLKVALRDIQ